MSHSKEPREHASQFFIGTIWFDVQTTDEDLCTWDASSDEAIALLHACRWQHEIAPDPEPGKSGHHIQIFCHSKKRIRWQALDKLFGLAESERHWDVCKGIAHAQECWGYCGEEKKDPTSRHGCPSQGWGERPGRGLDTGVVVDAGIAFAKSGKRLADILLPENTEAARCLLLHPSGFKSVRRIAQQPRNTPDEWQLRYGVCLWGEGGLGKSRRVRAECASARLSLWVAPTAPGGLWFDGYDGHDCALFDGMCYLPQRKMAY